MATSTFGTYKQSIEHMPAPDQIRSWINNDLRSLDQFGVLPEYMERHGLSKLPIPEYVSADMCYVYRPISDANGKVTGYRRIVARGLPDSLIGLIGKDFLLAPPAKKFETAVAGSDGGPADGAVQADTEEDKAVKPKIHCDRTWDNGKTCGRAFTTQGRLRRHIREKHAEVLK